jgi:hypothetical protein
MHLNNFIEEKELRIISFTYYLVQEIEKRVQNKVFYYKEQIDRFIEKRIDIFMKTIIAKNSLKSLYKYQIQSNVQFKLKYLLNNQILLSCV